MTDNLPPVIEWFYTRITQRMPRVGQAQIDFHIIRNKGRVTKKKTVQNCIVYQKSGPKINAISSIENLICIKKKYIYKNRERERIKNVTFTFTSFFHTHKYRRE